MHYEIVYGDRALDPLAELGMPQVLDCVEAAMNRLANDPVHLSRRSDAPFATPDGRLLRTQVFDFHCDAGKGRRVHFRAHFYYGEDERMIRVIALIPESYWRL